MFVSLPHCFTQFHPKVYFLSFFLLRPLYYEIKILSNSPRTYINLKSYFSFVLKESHIVKVSFIHFVLYRNFTQYNLNLLSILYLITLS